MQYEPDLQAPVVSLCAPTCLGATCLLAHMQQWTFPSTQGRGETKPWTALNFWSVQGQFKVMSLEDYFCRRPTSHTSSVYSSVV